MGQRVTGHPFQISVQINTSTVLVGDQGLDTAKKLPANAITSPELGRFVALPTITPLYIVDRHF